MKTNPLRTYCVALLGFSPTYIHHVRGQGMRLDSIRPEANADLMWGLKVEVGRKDSGEFLMAFHLGTSEGKNAPFIAFKRCGFKIKHHFQTPVPSDEGFISYDIELEGDGKKQYIYYDPILTDKKKTQKKRVYIPGCWKMPLSSLQDLAKSGMLVSGKYGTILTVDTFLNMALPGIYLFEKGEYFPTAYAVNAEEIPVEAQSFQPENSLVLPKIKFGATTFENQKIRIKLGQNSFQLPKTPYETLLKEIKGKGYSVTSDGKCKVTSENSVSTENFGEEMTITFPHKSEAVQVLPKSYTLENANSVPFTASDTDYWELGVDVLKGTNIYIDTNPDNRKYAIIPRTESTEGTSTGGIKSKTPKVLKKRAVWKIKMSS